MSVLSSQSFSDSETTEISQWLTTASRLSPTTDNPAADSKTVLETLNTHLSTRSTLLGCKPSQADVALYKALAPQIAKWSPEQRTGEHGYPHVVRHIDFVQNSALFELAVPEEDKVKIDPEEVLYVKPPVDAKAEKERLKKEKAAAAAQQTTVADRTVGDQAGKVNKKDKVKNVGHNIADKVVSAKNAVVGVVDPKQKNKKPAAASSSPLSPSLIDLRVGHILKAIKHPEADSLYVSTIAMGDTEGTDDTALYEGQVTRTVCSGLNGLIPLEDMQGRKVIVVANLKPVKMRGIKSCAMVLAASPRLKEGAVDDHSGPVELVTPPANAPAGQRVCFEGWHAEPEGVLNPKKKVWESIQPGFTTTDSLEVIFDATVVKDVQAATGGADPAAAKPTRGRLVTADGGVCTVQTLKDAVVR